MKGLLDALIEKSAHDLDTAIRICRDKPEHTDIVSFHCQQTIEKSLKAYLIYKQVLIKKNHDLIELLANCVELDSGFSVWNQDVLYRIDEIGIRSVIRRRTTILNRKN